MYASKSTKENVHSLTGAVQSVTKTLTREEQARQHAITHNQPIENKSSFSKGLKLLNAAWRGHTGSEQVGAPRAAMFNLGYDGWWISHGFAPVSPRAALSFLLGHGLHNSFTIGGHQCVPGVLDYIYRPTEEPLCYLEFVERYERVKNTKEPTEEYEDTAKTEFREGHPLKHSHHLRVRKKEHVALYKHHALPDFEKLFNAPAPTTEKESKSLEYKRRLYASTALILTVPWRDLEDLAEELIPSTPLPRGDDGDADVWWSAWEAKRQLTQDNEDDRNERGVPDEPRSEEEITKRGHMFLRGMQSTYDEDICNSLDELDALFSGDGPETGAPKDQDKDEQHDHDAGLAMLDAMLKIPSPEHPICNVIRQTGALECSIRQAPEMSPPVPPKTSVENYGEALNILEAEGGPGFKGLVSQQLQPIVSSEDIPLPDVHTPHDHPTMRTFVKRVIESGQPYNIQRSTPPLDSDEDAPPPPNDCPSIQQQADDRGLNAKQRITFRTLASAFLHSLSATYKLPEEIMEEINNTFLKILPLSQQLIALLAAEGGGGKSYVVDTFNEFARRWGSGGSVVTTASTGVAACLINGMTWYKSFGIGISYDPAAPTVDCKEAWQKVTCMVVDEVSVCAAGGLGVLDKQLKLAKDCELPYGGCHMIFVGDFCQLNCGGGVYTDDDGSGDTPHEMTIEGRRLWKEELNAVFILTESRRMENDEPWGDDCRDLRDHAFTEKHLERMDKRVVTVSGRVPQKAKIIVPLNKQREAINRQVAIEHGMKQLATDPDPTLTWRQRGSIVIDMKVDKRKGSKSLGPAAPSTTAYVRQRCEEKKLKGMMGELCFIIGESYSFTQGICVKRGLANGMWCTAKDLEVDETKVVWDPKAGLHRVSAQHVNYAVVQLELGTWPKKDIFADRPDLNMQPGHVPVRLNENEPFTLTVNDHEENLQITQLPLCLNKAITCHKAQVTQLHLSLFLFYNHNVFMTFTTSIGSNVGFRTSSRLYGPKGPAAVRPKLVLRRVLPRVHQDVHVPGGTFTEKLGEIQQRGLRIEFRARTVDRA